MQDVELIETIQVKAKIGTKIQDLTCVMENEITPRLVANIHDLEAVVMLDELILFFEGMQAIEPSVSNIIKPLYEIQDYTHKQNGIVDNER